MTQNNTATLTTDRPARPAWSVKAFANFWAKPDPKLIPGFLTPDVVGHWPGEEPVRGVEAYTQALAGVIALLPDIRLEIAEHAVNGEFVFIRWIMRATGRKGPFQFTGIDRVRVRDGLVAENIIRFDRAHLQQLAGLG
jgi:hypothetical protein